MRSGDDGTLAFESLRDFACLFGAPQSDMQGRLVIATQQLSADRSRVRSSQVARSVRSGAHGRTHGIHPRT